MVKTAIDEKDNQSCGNCYLHSDILPICILTGEDVSDGDTCEKWLTLDVCPECMIDFKKE